MCYVLLPVCVVYQLGLTRMKGGVTTVQRTVMSITTMAKLASHSGRSQKAFLVHHTNLTVTKFR